jgi:uncharacterized protein (DUF302 family)
MASTTTRSTVVEYVTDLSQEATLNRLTDFIEAAGMRIFARIDHAAGAREVGLSMRPAVVLIYGNPRGGTPIMQAAPEAALELPLRVLVREDDQGRVRVSFHPIAPLLREAGVDEELATRLDPAQQVLAKAIAS